MTTTHTHVIKEFANPFLRCDGCKMPVEGYVSIDGPECEHVGENVPCGHVGVTSLCPSWSPVDGCRCPEPHNPADELTWLWEDEYR